LSQISQSRLAGGNPGNLSQIDALEKPNNHQFAPLFTAIWLFLIAAAVMLVFAINRRGAFLADDYIIINQLTFTHTSFFDNLTWFWRDWGVGVQFYRPWIRLFYYFQFLIFGDTPYGWHLFSVFLHIINSWLVFGLAWKLSRRKAAGAVAGLIFALQPVHAEPVSWISGQTDLWATLFVLASAYCWITFRQSGSQGVRWYWGSVGLFTLGLLCKEVVIALPVALLAYDFVTGGIDRIRQHDDQEPGLIGRMIKLHSPFWLILLLYFVLRFVLFQGLGGYTSDPGQKIDLVLFLKSNLSWLAQPFKLGGTSGLITIGLVLAFLALTGVQERERHRLRHGLSMDEKVGLTSRPAQPDEELDDPYAAARPAPDGVVVELPSYHEDGPPVPYYSLRMAGFGFLWGVTFLLPTVLSLPAERFTYLPSAGFALFLSAALATFSHDTHLGDTRSGWRRRFDYLFDLGLWLRVSAIVVVLGVYTISATNRVQSWLDAGTSVRHILDLTKAVIPGVRNFDRFISEGVPDSNNEALIFRTGYRDAIQWLYKNNSLDAEKVDRLPITVDRLRNTIFLEYRGDRLINHQEIQTTLTQRNELRKQEKSFMMWDFTKQVPSVVSGTWFEPGSTGALQNRENIGLVVQASRSAELQSPEITLSAVQLGSLEITMRADPKGRAYRGEVVWTAGGANPGSAARSNVSFDIMADGQYHTYKVTPEGNNTFAYADQVARVQLKIPEGLDEVIIQKIEQFQIPVDYKPTQR